MWRTIDYSPQIESVMKISMGLDLHEHGFGIIEKVKLRGQIGNTQGSSEWKKLPDVYSSASLEEVSPENLYLNTLRLSQYKDSHSTSHMFKNQNIIKGELSFSINIENISTTTDKHVLNSKLLTNRMYQQDLQYLCIIL